MHPTQTPHHETNPSGFAKCQIALNSFSYEVNVQKSGDLIVWYSFYIPICLLLETGKGL